jgi:hypothetical protein
MVESGTPVNADQVGYLRNPFECTLAPSYPCYFDQWVTNGVYSPVNAYWEVQQGSYPVNNTFEVVATEHYRVHVPYWTLDDIVNGYTFDNPELSWIQGGTTTGQLQYLSEIHASEDYVPGSNSQPVAFFSMQHSNGTSWVNDYASAFG